MATNENVTGADIESLAAKLEGLSGSFSDAERNALGALFVLAGEGLAERGDDVAGFATQGQINLLNFSIGVDSGISLEKGPSTPKPQGGANSYLIGLLIKGVNGDSSV
jgi:hypothetical protein